MQREKDAARYMGRNLSVQTKTQRECLLEVTQRENCKIGHYLAHGEVGCHVFWGHRARAEMWVLCREHGGTIQKFRVSLVINPESNFISFFFFFFFTKTIGFPSSPLYIKVEQCFKLVTSVLWGGGLVGWLVGLMFCDQCVGDEGFQRISQR